MPSKAAWRPVNAVISFVDLNSIPLGAVDRIEIPNDPLAYANRAAAKKHKGDTAGAAVDLAKAKELGLK